MNLATYEAAIPHIDPVPENVARPLWSVMIPTYNCAHFLRQTLQSVLSQDPGPDQMQIEVVDDCSTKDDPEAVVNELGRGRVAFYRKPKNAGATAAFNTCIERSRGHLIHILHGDDFVLPGFYDTMGTALIQNADVGAASCRFRFVNEQGDHISISPLERETPGVPEQWLERVVTTVPVQFPAMVVRRSVYEHIGGFSALFVHTADWDMWKRIAVHYACWYEPSALACYRVHSASDTSRLARSGKNIADSRASISATRNYLAVHRPEFDSAGSACLARRNTAQGALRAMHRAIRTRDWMTARNQFTEAMRTGAPVEIVGRAVWILARETARTLALSGGLIRR